MPVLVGIGRAIMSNEFLAGGDRIQVNRVPARPLNRSNTLLDPMMESRCFRATRRISSSQLPQVGQDELPDL